MRPLPRPRVYYAREATPGRFVEIFEILRRDLGITMNSGRIGIKLHGDEVRINRPLWQALQAHLPGSFYVEGNWASAYASSGRGSTQGNLEPSPGRTCHESRSTSSIGTAPTARFRFAGEPN